MLVSRDIFACVKNESLHKKMKFSIKDFFSECFLWICSHLLKKSLMKNFVFCPVNDLNKKKTPDDPKLKYDFVLSFRYQSITRKLSY